MTEASTESPLTPFNPNEYLDSPEMRAAYIEELRDTIRLLEGQLKEAMGKLKTIAEISKDYRY